MSARLNWKAELLAELDGDVDEPDQAIERWMALHAVQQPAGIVYYLGAAYIADRIVQYERRRAAAATAGQPCGPGCDGNWKTDEDGRPVARCNHGVSWAS